ncbi:type VI secretion system protein ImpL [Paraburkholderia tropica]|uniref:Type VI secretion system protein ImpL n=1 Tax=Paraburkholderia tropica TaxID=92647 RepID=A0ABX5MHB5_9BURK|nr:type VI secretion system membrane subunit TssM [Paraburkholderia tropica]PXX08999.1 type VI secretion system protein ImpL [Paraburkholderia tropica]PZW74230.1 type VI secretion system protein ImpL [Paraburkholderia tropica]
MMMKLKSFFTRYGGSLKKPIRGAVPVLLILGLVFVLAAIWWLGPKWVWRAGHPLSGLTARTLLTLVVLLVPLVVWSLILRSRNRTLEAERKRDQELEKNDALRHVQAQERSLDRSLATLQANLTGRNALYQLPWYLVLGQENAGKTSFINRSGQQFSVTGVAKAASQQVSRDPDLIWNIDWWIGDHAVLIDPPGEIISQSDDWNASEPATQAAVEGKEHDGVTGSPVPRLSEGPHAPPGTKARLWENLIDWLNRNRSRRPLNGVVLVVDLVTLINQKPSDRKALAILLRTRLTELSRRLGTRPPVYVLLSKIDQLEGFDAFFSRLPRTTREDILGFTFTLDSVQHFNAWQKELADCYDAFISRLNEQVFDALGETATLEHREGLFSLVRELDGVRSVLFAFLTEVLGSDRYATPALPRGVYFSSVYQQGLLDNAFVAAAARSYGLAAPLSRAQPAGRGSVYFAQQLFQKVIYPEAGLAGDNLRVLADKRRTMLVSCGVAALGSLVIIGGWQHYYTVNRDMALSVLAKSREFSARDIDGELDPTGRNLLQPLDQIRKAVAVYGDYRSAWPGLADMGLYQGRKIGPKVDEAYLQLLSRRFLPELASGVMDALNGASANSSAQLDALRVYRMIEDRSNRRAPIVEDWMSRYWQVAMPDNGTTQKALMRHLDYAMKYADTSLPQYSARVMEIQQELRQLPMPQRVYLTIQQQAQEMLHAPLDLRQEVGPAFDIVYKSVVQTASEQTGAANGDATQSTLIPALLTARGFRDYFGPRSHNLTELAMIDQWTLGERKRIDYSAADEQALDERVRAIYSADYIGTWRRALKQLDIVDFNDIGQAASVLESLTSPAAPLRRLLETTRDNTMLYAQDTDPKVKTKGIAEPSDVDRTQAADIGRPFASLTGLLAARDNKPAYLDEVMAGIASVRDVVKSVQDSPDRGKAALTVVLDRFALKGPDPITNLQRIASGLPEPLNQQVKAIADQSSQVLLVEALRELERRWDTDVYSFYGTHLAGRYPFDPSSRTDASLEDFEAFFGPQGRLQQFRDKYLKVFLEDNLDALYSERRGGYLVRTNVMTQLEAGARIRDAFFNNRGALGVQFNVEPLGLTPNRRSSLLGVEGQLIPYDHGPSTGVSLIWPNSLGSSTESRITLVNSSGNSSSLVYQGAWSVFRLLSRARLNGATANSVDLGFTAEDGAAMRYRITAEKANNPFTQRIFTGFALPRTLLKDDSGQLGTPVKQAAPVRGVGEAG